MLDQNITDDGDSKKYWTQIPNIVFELGLKPHELVLYVHLKRAAGANTNGKCTKSTPTLVRETGMGAGTISRAKSVLETRRADLGGKPLIRTREVANPRGGKKRHEVIITDIWKENMARFPSSTVEIEARGDQVPVEVGQVPNPSSTLEIKKNPLEEKPNQEKLGTRARVPPVEKPRREEGQLDPPFHSEEFLLALATYKGIRKADKRPLQPESEKLLYQDFLEWGEAGSIAALNGAAKAGHLQVLHPSKYQNGNGAHGKQQSKFESASQRDARLIREGVAARGVSRRLALDNRPQSVGAIPAATGTRDPSGDNRGVG